MSKIFQRLKKEFLGVIPAAIFFFVAFQLLALTRSLILRQYDIETSTFFAATFGALVVAKVVMVADLLPFINRFPDRPLIYNILWKTAIYMITASVVRYIEHLVRFYLEYGNIAEANRHLIDDVVWPHVWVVHIWLLVVFLMYCVITELIRVLGRERVRSIFLGTKEPIAA